MIDNRWVVPYNPFLSLRNNCHINVEKCTSARAAKYLYEYVTKVRDWPWLPHRWRARNATRSASTSYEDLRSVGSSKRPCI